MRREPSETSHPLRRRARTTGGLMAGRIVSLVNLGRLREARVEAVALYRKVRQVEAADVVKHIYGLEHLTYDPDDFVDKTQPK